MISNLKKLKEKKIIKGLSNWYLIVTIVFAVWMLFIDENSYLTHRKFNKEIKDLKEWNKIHKEKIKISRQTIKDLKDKKALEKFAREHYFMKKENEDVYIIAFDTISKND